MDKLKELVCSELDDIAKKGITRNNIEVTGELVDIYKDLVNVEYWNHELKSFKLDTVDKAIGEIMTIDAELKTNDSTELHDELDSKLFELLNIASKIKCCMHGN